MVGYQLIFLVKVGLFLIIIFKILAVVFSEEKVGVGSI